MKIASNRLAATPNSLTNLARRFGGFVINPKELPGVHSAVVNISSDAKKNSSVIFVKDAFDKIHSKSLAINSEESKEEILKRAISENSRSISLSEATSNLEESLWGKFVDNLNPLAVSNLGLRESNNNLKLYNVCMPNKVDATDQERQKIIRKRSNLFRFFPLIASHFSSQESRWLDKFIGDFSYTTSQLKNLLETPNATVGFLKRAAGAPNLVIAKNLDQFLRYGLKKEDKKLYNNRVTNIPLLHEKEEQDAMWKALEVLKECDLTDKARAKIFLNSKNNWRGSKEAIFSLQSNWRSAENKDANANLFKDLTWQYCLAIADDLILPAYVKKSKQVSVEKKYDSSPLIKLEDVFTKNVRSTVVDFVQDSLLSKMTIKKLANSAEKFERVLNVINEAKTALSDSSNSSENDDKLNAKWHKIFPDQEINGIKFVVIDNDFDLKNESRRVGNCVINLSKACHLGSAHVVSGLHPSGEVFSIRLNFSPPTDTKIHEVNGRGNKWVSKDVEEAVKILEEKIANKNIVLNQNRGDIDKDLTIKQMLGFDFEKEGSVESVFAAYKAQDLLPVSANNLEDFYKEIDLNGFLSRVKIDMSKEMERRSGGDNNIPSSKISRFNVKHLGNGKGAREISYLD